MKKCTKCKIEKELDEFAWKNKSLNIKASECKSCHNIMRRAYYLKNKEKEIQRVTERRSKITEWYINYKKSLKCTKCGEDDYRCLQFHHLHSKVSNVSTMICNGNSIETIKKEISKCIVLCANCHSKEHCG